MLTLIWFLCPAAAIKASLAETLDAGEGESTDGSDLETFTDDDNTNNSFELKRKVVNGMSNCIFSFLLIEMLRSQWEMFPWEGEAWQQKNPQWAGRGPQLGEFPGSPAGEKQHFNQVAGWISRQLGPASGYQSQISPPLHLQQGIQHRPVRGGDELSEETDWLPGQESEPERSQSLPQRDCLRPLER